MKAAKILAVSILILAASVVALVWFFPSTGDFRTNNPFWNGLSEFQSSANATVLDSLLNLPANATGAVLVEIPYTPYNATDLVAINQFVNNGGTLLLMDDYGYGNQVLNYTGANMTFSGKPLLDPLFNYRDKYMPRISDFAYPLNGTGYISMNWGTALQNVSVVNVLAWSSSFSFLDVNNTGTEVAGDPTGPLPVIAYQDVGKGYVVAVSDPSIIINSMLSVDSNAQLASELTHITGTPTHVYIDQSHLPSQPLDSAKLAISTAYAAVSTPAGALSLIALAVALSTMPIWRKSIAKGVDR